MAHPVVLTFRNTIVALVRRKGRDLTVRQLAVLHV